MESSRETQVKRAVGERARFRFGIESLDKYYADALTPGTSILIAGHPGAGKTTFAATICYSNANEGIPCLYISFGEFKDKFYRHMKNFNMDFEKLEEKGLFKYIKLPLITSETAIDGFVKDLMESIEKFKAKIVVIDGVTPMLQTLSEPHARAFLQTVLYDVPKLTNGVLILIADLPFGEERIGFGGIDFVADIVILMKHRISRGHLVRTMELRKFRGAPISIAEIPFRIIGGIGIYVFIPPTLEEISYSQKETRVYRFNIEALDREIGGIKSGSSILIEIPPIARNDKAILALLAKLITYNKLRTIIINYTLTRDEFLEYLTILKDVGMDYREVLKYIVSCESINPARLSLEEIYSLEAGLVDRYRPDLIIYMGGDIVGSLHAERRDVLTLYIYNQLAYNKLNGVTTVWILGDTDTPMLRLKESLANYIIKVVCEDKLCIRRLLYFWSSTGTSTIIYEDNLLKQISPLI